MNVDGILRVGLLGAGGIAQNYLRTLDSMAGVHLAAVCDVDRARAEAAAMPRGARVYTDHRALLAEELDALFVCIPPFAHSDQVRLAAERGMAVFVAKPVGLDLTSARATLAALERSGVVNAVGYMWRYADITDRARSLLTGRQVELAIGEVLVGVPGTPWWGKRALSGGQIVEQATHVYDLIRYLCGEVVAVSGYGAEGALQDRVDFPHAAVVAMRLAGGGVATVINTCAAPDGRYALELVGREWRLRLDYGRRLSGRLGAEEVSFTGSEEGYVRQIHVFLDAVRRRDGSQIRSTYRDAVRTLALTLAADAAVTTAREVAVPAV